jgi:predicted TIM-barrel fold metal-dependent hydrolase
MSAELGCLSTKDLEILLRIQCEKVAKEAEVKRLAKRAAHKAEWVAAEVAAQKPEEEAKDKARRAKEAMEVVGSRSNMEPGPSQKGKAKARVECYKFLFLI